MKLTIVLGRGKCGISLVAGVLYKLGADFRGKTEPIEDSREKGVNIKGGYGGITFDKSLDFLPDCIERAKRGENVDDVMSRVREAGRKRKPFWGWKNPWTLLLVPKLRPLEPYYIMCRREIHAQAQSFVEEDPNQSMTKSQVIKSIESYNKVAERVLSREKSIEVWFEELTSHPRREIQRIINFLKIEPTQEQIKNAVEFVKPELKTY